MTEKQSERYFTINSNKLIQWLIDNKYIHTLGVGSRFDDDNWGLHHDNLKGDNTYNWELTSEGDNPSEIIYYNLSGDFDLRENESILVLSKHIGTDIRSGYEDDIIYLKEINGVSFYQMVVDGMHENSKEDQE